MCMAGAGAPMAFGGGPANAMANASGLARRQVLFAAMAGAMPKRLLKRLHTPARKRPRYYHAGLTFSDGFSDQLPGTVQ